MAWFLARISFADEIGLKKKYYLGDEKNRP